MSTGNWVKLDWDFGARLVAFVVPLRGQAGRDCAEAIKKHEGNIVDVCNALWGVLRKYRPEFMDGDIVSIQMHGWSFQLRMLCIDYTGERPKVPLGAPIPEERLDLCPCCGKPQGLERQFMAVDPVNLDGVEVCSQACVENFPNMRTDFTEPKPEIYDRV